jgi:hypothetical protein
VPFASKYYEEENLLVVALIGEVTSDSLIELLHELNARYRLPQGVDILWDGRRITSLIATPEGASRLVSVIKEVSEGKEQGRSAIVLRREERQVFVEMLFHMSEVRREPGFFATLQPAMAWLGRPLELANIGDPMKERG